jgi:hypothetical protein
MSNPAIIPKVIKRFLNAVLVSMQRGSLSG